MIDNKFTTFETAWCPGCGDFNILAALTNVLNELEVTPEQVVLVGGIGQAAKTNQYISANGFSGLHGRALPAASAMKLVNKKLMVIVNSGDGDSYGEGGNHFLHAMRRNVDITHFVHDNQVYGLTKGQVSPTSDSCDMNAHGGCNLDTPMNPMLLAIASGATFVARAYAGNPEHLEKVMKAAINHKGYALVDILQPCVSFNNVNTYAYYNQHVYELADDYDRTNKRLAIDASMEVYDKIPLGILYEEQALTYDEKHPKLFNGMPIMDRPLNRELITKLIEKCI